MRMRLASALIALTLFGGLGLPAQERSFPVDELRPGMVGVGRTVFKGRELEEFRVHVLGVLRNVIGTRRNLIVARLEGGPLADTGVIAGMSGSPVYIDGRLLGAVSYSLGQFSKEPIAGITPIDEMREAATLPGGRRQAARAELTLPLTQDGLRRSLAQAFSWMAPFADSAADVQFSGIEGFDRRVGAMLRPIGTPLTFGGFEPSVIAPVAGAFSDLGFTPVMAGAAAQDAALLPPAPLRPGDPVGVALMTGDLELGATGTVTAVDGDLVYAFGHPFYNLGPTQFPMTRAEVITVLPSLASSTKIASTGEIIGTFQQDRATTIAGTLGVQPSMIPVTLTLTSDRGMRNTFRMGMVKDQLFTPLLAYVSILNTLTGYERQAGAASYVLRGTATIRGHEPLAFEDVFTGDSSSAGAAAYVVAPLNFLLRNTFEDVDVESISLEIDASEQPRTATLERVWTDTPRVRPGGTVDLRLLLRTYRGEQLERTLQVAIPPNAQGAVSIMVSDGNRLSQLEARDLQVRPLDTRGVPQMLQMLNNTRKNNRLYVRLVSPDSGAVVRGEPLSSLPASVLAVMESDRNGGSFSPLRSALLGDWEISTDYVVSGTRTLTLTVDRQN
ncbi:MAG: hypothetical protein HOP14_04170 [Acidobacteria bacterium]|nr:hypothetical protein [Acidobacteriota bacterium]